MNNISYITISAALVAAMASSCKSEPKTNDIVVDRIVEKPQDGPERMPANEQNNSVAWIGGQQYSYSINRVACDSLPIVENHDRKYYDNTIRLVVRRNDGSVFFQKTFTKDNFSPVLPEQFKKTGALLGMHLLKAEGNNLLFHVSVGSPDENNEEFYYVKMILNNFGGTSAEPFTPEQGE